MMRSAAFRSPRARIVVLAIALILAPGVVLGIMGFRSIADRSEGLRTNYTATVALVRDRLEAELDRLESDAKAGAEALAASLDQMSTAALQPTATRELRAWLRRLSESPWIESPFFTHGDGGVVTSRLSSGWPQGRDDPRASGGRFGDLMDRAEAAEYPESDPGRAADLYRDAVSASTSAAQRCLALTRTGRSLFKAGRFEEGISTYRRVLEDDADVLSVTGAPCGVVALSQIATGFSALGAHAEAEEAQRQLAEHLVANPWDLQRQLGFYLARAIETLEEDSTAYAEASVLAKAASETEWIRLQIVPLLRIARQTRNDVASSAHLVVSRPHGNAHVGYRLFPTPTGGEDPGGSDASGIAAFGYMIRGDWLSDDLLPRLLESVDLGADLAVGVVDDQRRWRGDPEAIAEILDSTGPGFLPVGVALAESPLEPLPGWSVALIDTRGRNMAQIVARENRAYALLMTALVVVLAAGVAFTVRAAAHEVELSRLKSDFVANVTHELKTPLALIRMYGETLESGLVGDEAERREFFAIMRRESERLTHLINNVLDFGKIDSGAKEYSLVEEDLVSLVRDAVRAYRYFFDQIGAEVATEWPDEPIKVALDRDAIAQSLVNLLHNALKYGGGGKYVFVGVRRQDGEALVEITDRGVGIPSEELELIFEKYHRVTDGDVAKVAGSGLGLAIVKHAVEGHGGRVDVESVPGRGSTFTLRFPVGTNREAAELSERAAGEGPRARG